MSLLGGRIVVTTLEAVGVKADLARVIDELRARVGSAAVDKESIMELPERCAALLRGADHGVADALGRCAQVGDVHELEPSDAGADVLVDQSRLNLSRDSPTSRSKRITVFDDQHGRIGVADDVALNDQAVARSAGDVLDALGGIAGLLGFGWLGT